jgi:hypothetical protein
MRQKKIHPDVIIRRLGTHKLFCEIFEKYQRD